METSRRTLLGAATALPLLATSAAARAASEATIEADLQRYVAFGNKRAGGPGDMACGGWLASELEKAGYRVQRQPIRVPFFDAERAELTCGQARAAVHPQPVVLSTGPDGVTGPLVRVDQFGSFAGQMTGAIALVDLPFARWSSITAKPVRAPVDAAFAGGAIAAVVITNGPTGKVIALNADGRGPMFRGPVALLAPEDARPFLAAANARQSARLLVRGRGGTREAFNFVGRLDRGRKRWLAVSTPRSGWFTCGAERGGGVAAWLDLARWAPAALPDHDLAFICNTGHEYEYLGAAEAMKEIAPPVAQTRFWLHLGANFAARDWHEIDVRALPSVDPQRYLSVSPALLSQARSIFPGQPGFEAPVSSAELAAGELVEVIKAGYSPAAGVFGIHRYHHVAEDDARCLHAPATAAASQAFRRLIVAAI